MKDQLIFENKKYLSARVAAEEANLTRDYVSRLCRRGVLVSRREGKGWYVEEGSLRAFVAAQNYSQDYRRHDLVDRRVREYQQNTERAVDVERTELTQRFVVPPRMQEIDLAKLSRQRRVRENLAKTLDKLGSETAIFARNKVQVSSEIGRESHGVISPTRDFVHRVTALIATFVIVCGVYSLFNPSYASFAVGSVRDLTRSSLDAIQTLTSPATYAWIGRAQDQIATAVNHPSRSIGSMVASANVAYGALSTSIRGFDIGRALASVTHEQSHVAVTVFPVALPSPGTLFVHSVESNSSQKKTADTRAKSQVAAVASVDGLAAISLSVGGSSNTGTSNVAAASSPAAASIATAVVFSGKSVSYGDLVAYHASSDTYTLTSGSNDPNAYGVVVERPALLFKPGDGGTVPVVRSGAALINVTLENGPIQAGDELTASSIPGKAMRANQGDNVVAVANEAFTGQGGVSLRLPDGSSVVSGTITASVGIGGGSQGKQAESAPQCTSLACKLLSAFNADAVRAFGRYLLAGLIAILSITFAFRSYMSDANYGVVAMGRNPRARASIQSTVIFNAVLAMVIASAGLFASMVVILMAA